nr:MAG TPA: hypothetical protein [Caudoviricetes sp.]
MASPSRKKVAKNMCGVRMQSGSHLAPLQLSL